MLRHNWGLESEHATKPFKAKKRSISKCISFCFCNLSLRRENKYVGQRLILQEVLSCIFSTNRRENCRSYNPFWCFLLGEDEKICTLMY